MNLLLLFSLLSLAIVSLATLYGIWFYKVKPTILHQIIAVFGTALVAVAVMKVTITSEQIVDRLTISVPSEIYSEQSVADSIITDKVLYETLISMNAKYPKIILAQAKLESDNFKSDLFKRNNNLFGMKVPNSRVNVTVGGRAGYASYYTWRESVIDYLFWVKTRGIDKLSKDEYMEFLGKVYAEDPKYKEKVSALVGKMKF